MSSESGNLKLLSGFSEEILYIMQTNWELILKTQVEPRGGVLVSSMPPPVPGITKGNSSRADMNVGPGIQTIRNLGIRFWPVSLQDVHDVYGHPTENEFSGVPHLSMAVVQFNEESDKESIRMEFGQQFTRRIQMWIPTWEHISRDIVFPEDGDLVEFWGDNWEEFGVFYEMTKVTRQGFIHNTSYFVNFKVELQRRDDFVPERRLFGVRDAANDEFYTP